MKRIYSLTYEEGKFILKNTNPNEKKEPFVINEADMEFDTFKFYEYVFSDIEEGTEIEIKVVDLVEKNNIMKRIYATIDEICSGVIREMQKNMMQEV